MVKTQFIKVATAELPQIQTMYRLAFKLLYERYHDTATNPYLESLTSLTAKHALPNNSYYFFEVAGTIVGMARLIKTAATTMRVSPLLILPNYQNRGYAQLMLRSLETHFPAVNCWQLDTIAEEAKLVQLYQHAGYTQLDQYCDEIQPQMHLIYFEKRL